MRANEKQIRWFLIMALLCSIVVIIILTISIYTKQKGFAGSEIPPAGVCLRTKPLKGEYLRVKMTFKASENIKVRYFIWNGVDYARRCFTSTDGKNYTYDAYVPRPKLDSIPFDVIIRSNVANDNEVEYAIKVYDINDALLQKFPKVGETEKRKIEYLKYPLMISEKVTLKP